MKKASRNFWDSICNISRNPRMFYSMLNKISNHVSQDINTSNLIIHNNRIISNPQQQSNLFVNFFALRIQHEPIPLDYNGVHNSNLNHPIQIQETIKAIQTTRNSTPGADNIPAAWFKRLNNQQVHTLTASFQEIFITTNIPQQWKHSLIIPIPKPSKDKTVISSYRPIALTSVGAKIFEHKSLPKNTIESLFEDTIRTHFSNFFLIATDASKSQQITSIAGTSSTNSFAYRLQHLNTIFSAEALALSQALDELPNDEDNLLLLTDSLSVLQALANLSIKSNKIILRLAAKIATREKFHQNIVLLWTPGHAGIKWNEKADDLARRVSESDLNIQWVTVEDIITQLKAHSENKTDATYRGSKYYATLGDIPYHPNHSTLVKKQKRRYYHRPHNITYDCNTGIAPQIWSK
ncbi:hypothetical protein AVEN_186493-1 [Araneus ventricosus]|uniref:RNase H type-1 domain-containing protein n=1 Tax=Araneus ventricosus TaxID=182803 RepID=A0A4Y2UVS2_ARAVE|nr:hypothetical protein AVEN_186493-1 [Araneus ventricosus]